MPLVISREIGRKLVKKHNVSRDDVCQCFASCNGKYLSDRREDHKTNPPTLWFISETNHGRKLKVVFVQENGCIYIKTAYEPNRTEIRIYTKYTK